MIYTLGESLLDIIISPDGQTVARPGGSQLNVAVSLGRAGRNVTMISETGEDVPGKMLTDFLSENGVATNLIRNYPESKTSLAVAVLDKQKKPTYSFYKMYPEKRVLKDPPEFFPEDIFSFGSMYSCDPDIKKSLKEYRNRAYKGGATIIYDPNVRQHHHIRQGVSGEMLLENLAVANIIKGSDEDFENIFGVVSLAEIIKEVREINKEAVLVITLGGKGSVAYYKEMEVRVPAKKIDVVSTIGAGDAFTAGMISAFTGMGLSGNLQALEKRHLQKMLEEGTRFSALVCQSMDNYIPAGK